MKFVYHYCASVHNENIKLDGVEEMDFRIKDESGYLALKHKVSKGYKFCANAVTIDSLTLLHEEIYP